MIRIKSKGIKKKTLLPKEAIIVEEDMRAEYNFDYQKVKPNRFAARQVEGHVTVTLDPDVSKAFKTQDSVNRMPHALIEAMPTSKSRRKKASV